MAGLLDVEAAGSGRSFSWRANRHDEDRRAEQRAPLFEAPRAETATNTRSTFINRESCGGDFDEEV
jgi:hypothetical protein